MSENALFGDVEVGDESMDCSQDSQQMNPSTKLERRRRIEELEEERRLREELGDF